MAGSLKNIGLTSLDDLFKTDEQRQADAQERVQIVPADQVFPYARQPYSIDRPTQDLAQLMDSIERVGIAEPLIVRPRDGGGYEIIAGHRRDYCAKTIGLETRLVIVREYSDEDADIEKLLDTLTGANATLLAYANKKIEDLDDRRKKLSKAIADLSVETLSSQQIELLSGYLDDWEHISFEDKRKAADGLISSISATSDYVKIEWKI